VRRRGFTLLELLIVLTIAASAAMLALPDFSRLSALVQLRASARELASALRSTRADAIVQHRELALVIDLGAPSYRVEGAPRVHALGRETELKLVTAQSEVREKQVGAIRFFADGSSSGGRVALASTSARYIVDVDWLTGRVAIHE
jgi:general secretion pathway protein H